MVATTLSDQGAEVTTFDARELSLAFPGMPPTEDAKHLQHVVVGADAVVLATPEYHGSFSAMTKLVIENMGFPSALKGKPVALLGVAAGRIGAIKSLEQLRGVCSHVGAYVLPQALSIAGVRSAIDQAGAVVDDPTHAALLRFAESIRVFFGNYVAPRQVLEAMVRGGQIPPWTSNV